MTVVALPDDETPAAQQTLIFGHYVEVSDLLMFTGSLPYNLKNK